MYFSATSANWAPLLFQQITRCHSVFSCFSPPCPVHCRLVATDSVATRDPLLVLRTSGSAPRFPMSNTLFKLRLTAASEEKRGGGPRMPHSIWLASHSVNQRYATWTILTQPPPLLKWQCAERPRLPPADDNTSPVGPLRESRALHTAGAPQCSTLGLPETRSALPVRPAPPGHPPPARVR